MSFSTLISEFSSVFDLRFLICAGTLAFAGLVRGFSGFGGAMIFLPVAALLYGPKTAVVVFVIVDGIATLPILVRSWRICIWREVLPLAAGAVLLQWLGVLILLKSDPDLIRIALSAMILAMVALMATGWRYDRQIGLPATVAVGALAGFSSGAVGMGGPPVILFWLGGAASAVVVRANIFAFFGFMEVANITNYGFAGLLTHQAVILALAMLPVYALALRLGARRFEGISDRVYRRTALVIIAGAAFIGLPVWSALFG